jgi:3',5'-nucleoside bisphosphate phosphatase
MIRRCDLHMHTVHSDGTVTPTELVRLAKKAKLSCIALTDHDTLSGIEEAQAEGAKLGIEVISGVEVSVIFDPGTLHILGYFVDRNSPKVKSVLGEVQDARKKRNPLIIEKLQSLGLDITLEEVEAESGGGQVGRPHFAAVMIRKGFVKEKQEAFDKYLAKGASAYVDKRTVSSKEAIDMIEEAGGIASVAHPKQLKLDHDPGRFEAEIKRLKDEGIKGIEVYSSCQSKKEAARYLEVAKQLDLIVTGGSDFHGQNKSNVKLGWMGKDGAMIPYETIDTMKQMILARNTR